MKLFALAALSALVSLPAEAATRQEAEAALRRAETTEAEAAKLGNRWVPTEAALKAAQKALDLSDWDTAAAQAATALALARRSVEQAKEEEAAWRDAVIH